LGANGLAAQLLLSGGYMSALLLETLLDNKQRLFNEINFHAEKTVRDFMKKVGNK
jgi:hypothetical protein